VQDDHSGGEAVTTRMIILVMVIIQVSKITTKINKDPRDEQGIKDD
jgi:hypothetical protein